MIEKLSDNFPKVFYDHHGGGISNTNFPKNKSFYSENSYIEFGKNSRDQTFISFSKPSENWLLPYQLTEAGLAKILIIDERLVDIAEKVYEGRQSKAILVNKGHLKYAKYTNNFENFNKEHCKIHNIDAFWAANITVATHLNAVPIKEELFNEDWHHLINVNIDEEGVNTKHNFDYLRIENCPVSDAASIESQHYDAIIIHRTFFNKNSRNTHWNNRSEEGIFSLLDKYFPLVLITSGGGDMVTFNGNFKFISINHLLSYLKVPNNIGKHALIDEIFSKSKTI